MSHYFRSQEHSILVGVQTVIDDDPELTTRLVDGKNPIRIVLDPNNRIPNNSKVLSTESDTIIFSFIELINSSRLIISLILHLRIL